MGHYCVVVIPVYKEDISYTEEISLRQCCKVLGQHPICIVTHTGINLTSYNQIAAEYGVSCFREDFAPEFFAGVQGYNNLCLSLDFYKRFEEYDYMLIYQLDAYVFCDGLNEWCEKGYDYIGAPWFENWGTYEEGCKLWKVGNGGFSLRRVAWFTRFLSCKRLYGWKELKSRYYFGTLKSWLICVWHLLGRAQSIDVFLEEFHLNEDWVFCNDAMLTRLKPQIPDCETAAHFSFERSPLYLHTLIKGLPFGCHAWEKYEYDSFWKQYIPAK